MYASAKALQEPCVRRCSSADAVLKDLYSLFVCLGGWKTRGRFEHRTNFQILTATTKAFKAVRVYYSTWKR
jgi:hypothetical protein